MSDFLIEQIKIRDNSSASLQQRIGSFIVISFFIFSFAFFNFRLIVIKEFIEGYLLIFSPEIWICVESSSECVAFIFDPLKILSDLRLALLDFKETLNFLQEITRLCCIKTLDSTGNVKEVVNPVAHSVSNCQSSDLVFADFRFKCNSSLSKFKADIEKRSDFISLDENRINLLVEMWQSSLDGSTNTLDKDNIDVVIVVLPRVMLLINFHCIENFFD